MPTDEVMTKILVCVCLRAYVRVCVDAAVAVALWAQCCLLVPCVHPLANAHHCFRDVLGWLI